MTKLIHVVGRQNNGKTTLMEDILKELTKRGLKAGTIKHSWHKHELDKPGKDSFRHREAGGNPAAIITKNLMGVYLPVVSEIDSFDYLLPFFKNTNLVLVEGGIDLSHPNSLKIEVWRKNSGKEPLVFEREEILAVVTDDPIQTDKEILPRNNIVKVVDYIERLINR